MASTNFNIQSVKYHDHDIPVATTTSGIESFNLTSANVILGVSFLYNSDYYYEAQKLDLAINGKQVVLRISSQPTVARTIKVRVFYI